MDGKGRIIWGKRLGFFEVIAFLITITSHIAPLDTLNRKNLFTWRGSHINQRHLPLVEIGASFNIHSYSH